MAIACRSVECRVSFSDETVSPRLRYDFRDLVEILLGKFINSAVAVLVGVSQLRLPEFWSPDIYISLLHASPIITAPNLAVSNTVARRYFKYTYKY